MALEYDTVLLSAAKTGNPPLADSSLVTLSAYGVNVITLSTNDVGIAFTQDADLTGALTQITVQGSVFKIDQVYNGTAFALVKTDGSYTTFTYASAYAVQPLSALTTGNVNVSTPNTRRLYLYGYR